QCLLHKVIDEGTHGWAIWTNALGTQFGFGLRFEYRFLHLDGNGANDGSTNIRSIEFLFIKFTDRLHDRFTIGRLMRTTLRGMLSVDKGIIFFTILLTVGHGDFNIISLKVNDRIAHAFGIYVALQ